MKWHQLGLAALTTTVCSIYPYRETIAQQFSPTSWTEVGAEFFNLDPDPPGESGSGIGRGDLCQISPQKQEKIWSDRPLFLLTEKLGSGPIEKIELRSKIKDSKTTIWSGTPIADESIEVNEDGKIIYIHPIAYDGEPALEPGKTYHWLLFLDDAGEDEYTSWISFEVMPPEERDPITAELQELTDRLKAEGAQEEAIALDRARYFADKEMWADALQEAYSVPEPSEELMQLRQTLPIQLTRQRCQG